MGSKENLFGQFPPVTTAEWMDKIQSDLKGADFRKKLVWKTPEGLEVMPFYRAEDITNQFVSDVSRGWLVRQDVEVTNYEDAGKKALSLLMRGVDSLGFIISDPDTISEANFNTLLKGIHPEAIELNFLSNGKAKELLQILESITSVRGLKPEDIRGAIETDPLGRLMINGTLCIPPEAGFDYLADLSRKSLVFPNLRTIHINVSHFTNAGADIVTSLGFGIAMGVEYINQLTGRGLTANEAFSRVRFSFGTGSSYFSEIAALRAARLLWSVVQKGFEVSSMSAMEIHCVTSKWNMTAYDPYVNMLRTQSESMSAVLGGANSLTVLPFDTALRKPGEFSERIARNQQIILKEEAHFDKVADPSAGSYYIEKLTELLSDSAWKLFLEVEEKDGFLEALKSGFIQARVKESSEVAKRDISTRKTVLLGTNQYPLPSEKLVSSVDSSKLFGDKSHCEELTVEPVLLSRGSVEYEKLRLDVEKSSKRPVVFLLTIGNPVMRRARSQFSAVFFGCAGYEIIDNNGFQNSGEAIKAALESKSDIVVLCSSDEEYETYAPEVFSALKDKSIVAIAGNPACAGNLKKLGIEHFIHMKSNVPETIMNINKALGI